MYKNAVLVYNVKENIFDIFKNELKEKYNLVISDSEENVYSTIKEFDIKVIICEYSENHIQLLSDYIERKSLYIPIICLGGNINNKKQVEILNQGASTVLCEPYSKDIIRIKLENCLEEKIFKDNIDFELKKKMAEVEKSRNTIIIAMSILAESRDNSTGDHLIRMQGVTRIIANKFLELYPDKITKSEVDEIILFAPLHDIGKIPIPDNVLKNTGKYSECQMEIMRNHTVMGGDLLLKTQEQLGEDADFLKTAIEIATYHHEKFDGTGYPYGLKGENIPISARIVSVADVYDALISPRLYKEGFTKESAIDIIINGDDRIMPGQFDPKVIDAFKRSVDDIERLYELNYNNSWRVE